MPPSRQRDAQTSDRRFDRAVRTSRSRRRFLASAGLIGGALLIEAGASAVGPIKALAGVFGRGERGAARTSAAGTLIPPEELVPTALPTRPDQPSMAPAYRTHLRTKIGQMLLLGFEGTVLDDRSALAQAIREGALGGVLLFDRYAGGRVRNVASPDQLRRLTAALQGAAGTRPLIVAVDQEGGHVARLSGRSGFPGTYSAASLGGLNDPGFTEAQGAAIGRTLANAGINLNLAPVVDMNLNRRNEAIGGQGRTFSHTAEGVTRHAGAFIAGLHAAGIACTLKHFPGQGSAGGDTHHGAVDVTHSWSREELRPFAELIATGAADAIMTGHIRNQSLDPVHPATLSATTLDGLLRTELGYGGVVITDDLAMEAIRANYRLEDAAVLAVEAGVDILTIGHPGAVADMDRVVAALVEAVESGRIGESRIDASYERIQALRARLLPGASA